MVADGGGAVAPQGAERINDEFEVGYSEPFERRWRRAELIGHAVMALFVLAGIAGLLGQGPLSHHSKVTPNGMLRVDFEPVARYDTGTQVTFHLSGSNTPQAQGSAGDTRTVRLFVSSSAVEPLGLQRVVPQPLATEAVDGGIVFSFAVPPGRNSGLVRLMLKPAAVGPVRVDAYAGNDAISWTQVVLP
jgi:hypothetical protein